MKTQVVQFKNGRQMARNVFPHGSSWDRVKEWERKGFDLSTNKPDGTVVMVQGEWTVEIKRLD